MTDVPVTAASAASAATGAATAAAMSSLPNQEVIVWAVIGGLVSVWLARKAEVAFTPGYIATAIAQIGVSAASGIALSALVLTAAPGYAWLAPLASVPRWALAGCIAALIHQLGPLALSWLQHFSGTKGGGNV